MQYKYLITQRMRKDVLDIGDKLATYMHDNNIENIMLMDRSARPTYLTLKNSWNKLYPRMKCPNIYFTNPQSYDLDDKPIEYLAKEFNKTYFRLAENKNASIMLFDVCMHRGNAIGPIIKTIKKAGYSNLIIGLTQPVSPSADGTMTSMSADFIAINHSLSSGCYPFRRDDLTRKHYSNYVNLLSKPEPHSERGVDIRREMNAVFKGNIESNYYD